MHLRQQGEGKGTAFTLFHLAKVSPKMLALSSNVQELLYHPRVPNTRDRSPFRMQIRIFPRVGREWQRRSASALSLCLILPPLSKRGKLIAEENNHRETNTMDISRRVAALAVSATLEVTNKAAELRRKGVDIIGFGAGEPDFPTPENVKAVGMAAIQAGHTGYAKPSSGIPEAKAAVCEKFRRENGLSYAPDQVIVTVGGKEALYLACAALLNPGDEAILPVPYWVSFPEQIKLCDAKIVEVRSENPEDLRLTPRQIAAAVTDKTKIIIFNSPSNPSGFAYNPDEVRAIAAALSGRDITIFSDEMYDRLRFGDRREHLSFAGVSDEWFNKTITFNAASKTHAMTGWRIGYAAGPTPIIKAMAKLQSHTTSGTATFVQHALVEALTGNQTHVEIRRAEFEKRGYHMHARLNALADVTCVKPSGAFYCFPNVSKTYHRLGVNGSKEFCNLALEQAHVALVPGIAFGSDDHVRLSFASGIEHIDRGLDRMEKLLGKA